MHDPMVQAFEIKYPWRAYRRADRDTPWTKSYRAPIVTIWHVDPERDGSDDSCGWSSPKLNKHQASMMDSIARDEAREPYFLAFKGKRLDSPTEAETLLRQAFYLVGFMLNGRNHKPLCNFAEAQQWACEMLANPIDNFRTSLAFLPGYHSNSETDDQHDRERCARQLFGSLARFILRERRPWYRHPRYHIWHWHFQIHPVQAFKRWAFSRCSQCGGRFTWGYSPVSDSWNGTGPLWFRSEQYTHHLDCRNPTANCMAATSSEPTSN